MTYTSVTTERAVWKASGRAIRVSVRADGTTGGSAANSLRVSPPVPFVARFANQQFPAMMRDAASGFATVGQQILLSATGDIYVRRADSGNYGLGSGRLLDVDVTYEF